MTRREAQSFRRRRREGGVLVTDCLLFTYLQSISSVTILRAGNGVHLLTRHDKEEGFQTLPRARRHRRRATSSLFWSTLIKINEKKKTRCLLSNWGLCELRGALWKEKRERKKERWRDVWIGTSLGTRLYPRENRSRLN